MEHIVLEYDESTRTALVVATSNKREPVLSGHASPYIVADGYDFESRSWGAGHYFTDIAAAKIDYERSCRHSYPLAEGKLRDDEFCTIRWCREDVATALSEYLSYPIPATKKNIDDVVGQLMAHGSFQDRSIENGWETISAIIDEDALDLGLSTKQGVDFYRDAFGHWNSTEAIVWPSSEGDAAFVMAVPADSEDGDLAVYKIDACLIGDDEITVDDIERLGGKRELCVYKHGFDGIEAIRNFANRVAVDRFDERFGVNNLYGDLPDLAPTLRKVTEGARTTVQTPRDPQAIAAAALSAAEGGAKGAVEHVGNIDLGLGSSQADNFYRGVYDVTAHHNSMFWPSGDGSAVHVSHCRLGDGPSFGLTVRTIPAAAIGNEPVTFEKIDRLGGKIELCVDNIGQDIEKVRAFAGSSPVVRAFVEPLCAYIPEPSDSVREAKRDISPYLRQTAQRCQRISHPIDPDESASSARCATFGGAAALPAHRGYKHR